MRGKKICWASSLLSRRRAKAGDILSHYFILYWTTIVALRECIDSFCRVLMAFAVLGSGSAFLTPYRKTRGQIAASVHFNRAVGAQSGPATYL